MLPFSRDFLVALVNLAWLALALAAAWAIGERRGAGAISTAGVAWLMALPLMNRSQAGTAGNDTAAVALLLAGLALLLEVEWGLAGMVVAGAAVGMSVGTKLYSIAPAAALTVGILFLGD